MTGTEPAAPQTPIDWALLDSVTGGDRQAADDMLREFRAVMPGYRSAMEKVLADGDLAAVSGLAHRFKGTVSMLGARPAAEAFAQLQAAAAAGDPDAIRHAARAALVQWDRLSAFLQARGAVGGDAGPGAARPRPG